MSPVTVLENSGSPSEVVGGEISVLQEVTVRGSRAVARTAGKQSELG